MITENIIITVIICITIISICFIIGYYSNKESKQQKLKNIRDVVCNFSNSYIKIKENEKEFIKVKENEKEFIGNSNDIINIIRTIRDLTY